MTAVTSEKGKLKTHTARTDGEATDEKKQQLTNTKRCSAEHQTLLCIEMVENIQTVGKEPMLVFVSEH